MNWLVTLTAGFEGSRSKISHLGAALVALAGFVGFIPNDKALMGAGTLMAIGMFFQRVASANSETRIIDLIKASGADKAASLLLMLICSQPAFAEPPAVLTSMQLSEQTRSWFRNPDGSCVQCSIGMAGVHCNDPNAATLLWDSPYGTAVRGGSWPSRVEQYCDRRGIKAWSVTGQTVDDTMPWIEWAAKTGRFAAIGAGTAHFQTLYGYEPGHQRPWMVCNNNSPHVIDRYSDREFRNLHAASGPWVVILQKPSSNPPAFHKWWK